MNQSATASLSFVRLEDKSKFGTFFVYFFVSATLNSIQSEAGNKMSEFLQNLILIEKGCRRCKIERRVFSYSVHIPERRSGKDRRCAKDPKRGGQRGEFNRRKGVTQPAMKARFNKPGV